MILQNVCLTSLNSFELLKKKYVTANLAPFMNKELKKAIKVSSKSKYKFLKSRSEEDRKAYNKQRNICVQLLRYITVKLLFKFECEVRCR